ncbi:WD repeat containing protein pop1 [Phlyctema vagabunda]|uniref:WD repeat containing protein pop1 n=1 Tax=Phlyctema vagabunda TaxID=108571 RepID=A0ABR4P8M3_9HELO
MEPAPRVPNKRRAASVQVGHSAPQLRSAGGSATSFAPTKDAIQHTSTRRPKTSHSVSVGWEEEEDMVTRSSARLQIELAECVETKTVTTTTTTKRSYPPLLVRPPQALEQLDSKEYPLASKPTPSELSNFSYEFDGRLIDFSENEPPHSGESSNVFSDTDNPASSPKAESRMSKKRALFHQGRPLRAFTDMHARSPIVGRGQHKKYLSGTGSHHMEGANTSTRDRRLRHSALGLSAALQHALPATPDASELEISASGPAQCSRPSTSANDFTPRSALSQNDPFDEAPSPSEALNAEVFSSAVATPPVAESDLEPFDAAGTAFPQASVQRPTLNTLAAQNASLPSPGLSPTFAAAEMEDGPFPGPDNDIDLDDSADASSATQCDDSQDTLNSEDLRVPKSRNLGKSRELGLAITHESPSILNARSMIETFDSMPDDMKSFMMYQFLRRCPRKTLHVIANVVNPALKCDFLDQLPIELSLHILSFLDYRDLCRAAQVSKQWRNVIDTNETGWKELFDQDGFALPAGELERAIHQGWGWQDPFGVDGYEQDLSVRRDTAADGDATGLGTQRSENETSRKVRPTTKRKRAIGASNSERAKRRAVSHEFAGKALDMVSRYPHTASYHKSEGPLTAANAAAVAVPDPQLGLPGLQKLHLFKSLYRRHFLLKKGWTSGKVEPHHLAFPAHATHVITCLQFDDDKILTGSDDTLIHIYDTKTGRLRKKLEGHEGGVWALQYEGNVLVSGSTDRSVRVWDIEKGLCTQVFGGHTSTVRCLQILMPVEAGRTSKGQPIMQPEKPLIITGSRDSQLRVWKLPEQGSKRYIHAGPQANDADCPYFVRVLNGHSHSVRAIAAHQDTLVSGSYDFTVRVWKISTGETLHRLTGHTMKVYSVVLDHERKRCISGSMDNLVKIWSIVTGQCLFTLEGHTSLVGLLDLSNQRLVSAAADSTLRIWDPENGQCKSTLSAHTGAITCFQHDGQKVISGSDRTLKMWNVKTGECIKDLLTDLSGVWQVKFDERRCVAAVQRNDLTFVEVLDFGASRDGVPASQRGSRTLLNNGISDRFIEEEDA